MEEGICLLNVYLFVYNSSLNINSRKLNMEIILNKYIWYYLIFYYTSFIIFDILLICFFDTLLIISMILSDILLIISVICFHNKNILTHQSCMH